MADERLLPPGIADARGRAFLELIEGLQDIDLTPLLVYRIESVPASALYALAWQFGVTGFAGWDLANTEVKRRELLRRAIEFHRFKGTSWVVKEALKALGYETAEVIEHFGRSRYDGAISYDGSGGYSAGGVWGDFAVLVGAIADDEPLSDQLTTLIRGVIESWKNARSRLVEMSFAQATGPDMLPALQEEPMDLTLFRTSYYSGELLYDGEIPYSGTVPEELGAV